MTHALEPCEEELTNPDELWFRHVFPAAADDRGVISYLAFRLTSDDMGKLSGVRGGKQSAEAAFNERRRVKPNTVGTWAVSVAEIQSHGLRCIDDSECPSDPPKPTGHSYIDMRDIVTDDQRYKNVRQELADSANDRGRQHP